MPDRFEEVRRHFDQLVDLPAGERDEALERICDADDELRRELGLLLRADEGSEGFLTPPGPEARLEALRERDSDLPPGTMVGQFRVLRLVASGGMGRVYEAEQERPRRRVALKTLRLGLASAEARRRFAYESEVLARLRHPFIAQIFEVGTHRLAPAENLPYFAMEYVPAALPITAYAGQNELDTEARLTLFRRVCEAVHHGHQRGVIHRDLKPANILVDAEGRPKVIDFGVARVSDADLGVTKFETGAGQLVGTAHYMSPEQVSGQPFDLDIRSDVYALGVVLYELLCGRLPYDVDGLPMLDVVRVIRERPPLRPCRVAPDLAGDIEVILLKALEKDRDQRYPSTTSFAHDILHFLRREPIEARPRSFVYHVALFARRNRVVMASLCAIFVVLSLSVFISVRYALLAQASEREAVEASAEARQRLDEVKRSQLAEAAARSKSNDLYRDLLETSQRLMDP